ncbi:MAG: ATP-binding cassette domain-containing protein [Candidatus Marinimicrobia bacterium]|nr:ATP-binding cassette domain-containing protein [Candidatus Neomarinimicrobiota bacterium]
MSQKSTLIYELNSLKKTYGDDTVLNIRRLQFHRGTIYGVIGTIGSGKSTLFNIMAGADIQSEGTVKYDDGEFETNWLGKIKQNPEIKLVHINGLPKGPKVSDVIAAHKGKLSDQILAKYFNNGSWKSMLSRNIADLSNGELALLNLVNALETDPRVLLVDDYAVFFDNNIEGEFRRKLNRMNKELGTTIILSAQSDQNLKRIASVLIYLDNGHISKIRSGVGKSFKRNPTQRSSNQRQSKKRQSGRSRQRSMR